MSSRWNGPRVGCPQVEELLNESLDGELTDAGQRRLEAHLAQCSECRKKADAARSLGLRAASLPVSLEPGRDLWPAIAHRLKEAEATPAAAHQSDDSPPSPARHRAWRWAALLLIPVAVAFLWTLQGPSPAKKGGPTATAGPGISSPQSEGDEIETLIAEARATLERQALHRNPGQGRAAGLGPLEEPLDTLDEAIVEIRRAIAKDPENASLQRTLFEAYRKQLELLRLAARHPIEAMPRERRSLDRGPFEKRSLHHDIA